MKRRWLILAVLFPLFSLAQGNERIGFTTISSVGLITGESTAKPSYQFSAGVASGRWFAGVGVAYDQYKFNSFPVFADGRLAFGKDLAGFLYAQAGYNFPAADLQNKDVDTFWTVRNRFEGGFYMDAGGGYRIRFGRVHRLLFSVGYSQKHLDNIVGYRLSFVPCFPEPCEPDTYEYRHRLGRVVAKLSWSFGRW